MTKSSKSTDKNRFETSPFWIEKKVDAKHRETIRASVSLEADDDWLDDEEVA